MTKTPDTPAYIKEAAKQMAEQAPELGSAELTAAFRALGVAAPEPVSHETSRRAA